MDTSTEYGISGKQDEVQRLKDVIKNLELENQLLRSRSKKTIGEDDKGSEAGTVDLVLPDVQQIDPKDLLNLDSFDFSDEEMWLYKSNKYSNQPAAGASPWNPQMWLRSHIDSNLDFDFQQMRRMLTCKLEELDQGSRRNNIDTRTFTRPKKRLSRPGLQTMAEAPLLTNTRGMNMPYASKTLTIRETINDISMPLNTTVTTHCLDTTYLNANFQKLEEDYLNKHQLVENTRNIMFQKLEDTGLNSTFRKSEDLLMQNDEWPRSNKNFSKILSEPHLNTTTELRLAPTLSLFKGGSIPDELHSTHNKSNSTEFNVKLDRTVDMSAHGFTNAMMQDMAELNATFQVSNSNRSRDSALPVLDGTFCVSENERDHHSANKRAASCDSVGDEDYSSASDCSFGVSNGQNDALGDVQNRARLQEESLKLTVSTPEASHKRGVIVPCDLPSPIPHVNADGNHGYQSDHSDHSSLAKSSRSSQRSSPAISPYGSTNMLAPVNGYYLPVKQQMAGSKVLSRNAHLLVGQRPNSVASRDVQGQHDAVIQNRPLSGLRPPVVRSQGNGGSALPRPTTGIPRPRSRIPAPKTRNPTVVNQPPTTANWMDGCY